MALKIRIKIIKSGGSLRMTVPHPIVQQLNLKVGDNVLVGLENERIIVEKEKKVN